MSSATTPFLAQIQSLLSRHRNAIFGRNFYSELQPDNTFRNSMYLEVLISVLLYYVRGYFPNLLNDRWNGTDDDDPGDDDDAGNDDDDTGKWQW